MYSVISPAVVMRPTLPVELSLKYTAPSGPAAMSPANALAVGSGYSSIWPSVVMRPILSPRPSVNHSAPSAPLTMSIGNAPCGSG